VVSTGEQPATSFTTHQGASPRVLSICSPPFGTDGQASCAAAEAVKQGAEAHYGTAGPAFVARLQARLEEDSDPGKLRARHGELTEMLRGGTDMTGRRAPLVACLALAARAGRRLGHRPVPAARHRRLVSDVRRRWLEMGALLTMDTQRPAHSIPRRTAERLSRHLVFRREILDPHAASADGQRQVCMSHFSL
jgi:hypothetical protein